MEWNPERARVEAESRRSEHWSLWGPYVSARQWGTVREDYSATGEAWTYFPFEHAAARAYRWGEDGIFGISDDHQRLCFAPAFWNERDPILKERFFGLGGSQGNHGEDVKECYYHLDNVPSHAYMKALYKYPQAAFPYRQLVDENARRSRADPEFELVDTGIFDDDAYFDIVVEYAKRSPSDILIRISATNRGRVAAPLHVVPQLWYRNQWSWSEKQLRGTIAAEAGASGTYLATHPELGAYRLYAEHEPLALFTENETNQSTLFGAPNAQPYVKDAIGRTIVNGERGATNPNATGSKLALHYATEIAPGASHVVRLRLAEHDPNAPFDIDFDTLFESMFRERIWEAERFYNALNPYPIAAEAHRLQRTALAGMLWSKQYYHYVIRDWLKGDALQPAPPAERRDGRNHDWTHLYSENVLSMPDTWEYPWFAAWDLAFHMVSLALVDPGFAKHQLVTLTREWYMHPSGALPAYEWAFSDVNPPVHAWSAYRIFQIEHKMYGVADYLFLERVFQKLLLNFTWWVNREDPNGENVFTGGFMGLDNVGIFDRSRPLPGGGRLVQSDSTSWMAVYALDMMAIALELAQHNVAYEDIATKFFEHFLYIASAINDSDEGTGLWNEEDGFYYDRLVDRDGTHHSMRVRSLVGLTPLFAVQALVAEIRDRMPDFSRRVKWFIDNRPELSKNVASLESTGMGSRMLLAIVDGTRLKRLLRVMFDEDEFLSPSGIRSLSKFHQQHPLVANVDGHEYRVDYEPAESRNGLFGGNSNWRGPVWMPINYLIIESLQLFHFFYGDDYRIEFPTNSGRLLTLWEIATELSHRLLNLFLPAADGRRPFNGGAEKFQRDPHFRDLLLFYEYFNGDDGAGLGAAHQTGWTGLVAKLVQQMSEYEAGGKSPLEWHYDASPNDVIVSETFARS